jgi:hypothetical protein
MTVKTTPFSDTYSGETYPLGSIRVEPAVEVTAGDASLTGDRVWMFVQADGSGVAVNDLLQRSATSSSFVAATSAASADKELINLLGVADHAIAADQYGWIVVKGECVVKTAGVSAGNNLTSIATAATAGPATGGATDSFAVFGRAITATGSGVSDAYVDFR